MNSFKKLIFPGLLVLTFSLLIFQSCMKKNLEFDKLSDEFLWTPSLAVPIAHSSVTLRDILRDYDTTEIFEEGADASLYFNYHAVSKSFSGIEAIYLPDQDFPYVFTGNNVIAAGFTPKANLTYIMDTMFTVNGNERLDSVVFKGASNLHVEVVSTFLHTGVLTITFPYMKKNGVAYSKAININTSDGSFTFSNNYPDLAGYSFDLTGLQGNSNKAFVRYDLSLNNDGNAVSNSDVAIVSIKFTSLEFAALYGFIGTHTLDLPYDTVHIELFDNLFEGDVWFEDPQLRIYTENSYGVPITFYFDTLTSWSKANDNFKDITGTGVPLENNPRTFGSPTVYQAGTSVSDSIILDRISSNLNTVIYNKPKYLFFKGTAIINADSTLSNANFALDTSRFSVDVNVSLPLWGRAFSPKYVDTVDVDMSSIEDSNQMIKKVVLRLDITNGMPAEIGMQVLFLDSNYKFIDKLLYADTIILAGATVDLTTGKVDQATGKTRKITDFVYTADRIALLKDVKYMVVYGDGSTPHYYNDLNIRIYADYTIDVKVGMFLELEIESGDF